VGNYLAVDSSVAEPKNLLAPDHRKVLRCEYTGWSREPVRPGLDINGGP